MSSQSAIRTEKLTKHYGDFKALIDLDLDVRKGEVFGFLGPNGAGKSTTIRTLLDLIRPTSGRAWIMGIDTHEKPVQIRRHIGYLPSDLTMYPALTGRDTLTYFANLRGGVDWSFVDALAGRLDSDLSKKVGDYSSGNRQKVGIIQAFMNRPDVIIMDEPSSGLDPLVQREFQTMMREVSAEGRTVFLSSHTLSEVQRAADRVGIIRHGHLVDVKTVQDLRSKAIRKVELTFDSSVDARVFEAVPGVRDVTVEDDRRVELSFDGHMQDLLAVATDHYRLIDINSTEADLEEIFLAYYRDVPTPPTRRGLGLMYANIFTKAVHDKWVAMGVGGLAIGLLLWMGMAVYADIDTSFYYELPAALLEPMGISSTAGGVGGIAYGSMYNLMGAMTIAGLAISIGASTIAGEERDGTIGLLLGNPKSRSHVGSRIAALVVLLGFGAVLLWGAGLLVPLIVGVDITGVAVGALVVHLGANALTWGMLAVVISSWTGSRTAASAVPAGAMVLSWLVTSFLPLIEGGTGIAELFPWYYFNASQPEVNGIDWGHLGVLLGLSAIFAIGAFVGVNRRDLRGASAKVTVLDRLRNNPRTRTLADRVAGTTRVSSITAKAVTDHQGLMVSVIAVLFYVGLLLPPMYNLLPPAFTATMADLPEALISMIGGVDMSTPTGWIQGETFSLLIPIAFITVLAVVGSRALAGEERDHTMGLLLANPVSRAKIVRDKVQAMLAYGLILGAITWVTNAAGIVLAGLEVSLLNLVSITALGTLLGLVFGAVALALSAATGRVAVAVYGAAGLGLVSYFIDAFFPLSDTFADWAVLSPFHYYLSSDPLVNGMNWTHAGVLSALFGLLVAAAIPLFNRRDLRG